MTADDNPNRPTEPGYCALCVHTPCMWLDVEPDVAWTLHGHRMAPVTAERAESDAAIEAVDALTDTQRSSMLYYLLGAQPRSTLMALAHVQGEATR